MSVFLSEVAEQQRNLESKVRDRMAVGAPIWEIAVDEMPLWLLKGVRTGAAPIKAVFMGPLAGMIIHQDGGWTLRACPAEL